MGFEHRAVYFQSLCYNTAVGFNLTDDVHAEYTNNEYEEHSVDKWYLVYAIGVLLGKTIRSEERKIYICR
jgi:hypothetical protein